MSITLNYNDFKKSDHIEFEFFYLYKIFYVQNLSPEIAKSYTMKNPVNTDYRGL